MAQIGAPGTSTRSISPMSYHVFLSFRGIDTRTNFADHLYSALCRKGIVTFRDNEDLEGGEVISEKLLQSIEQSLFAIVVLSKNFASSSWCLNELQKIVESKQDQTVFPIFYGVDPSDIRRQKEDVAKAFEEHERRIPVDKVRGWREALTKVANLSGWDTKDKHEAEIVEDIAKFIWNKLCDKLPYDFDHLVGDIQSKVDTIISMAKIGLDERCFIGICGMGGIGKTTLAYVVYEAIRRKFDASCFLADVRTESENVSLQKKLLSCLGLREPQINNCHEGKEVIRTFLCHKKVLIILDNVDHRNQLDNLAGKREWFGARSKVIITTRDAQLLRQYEQFEQYDVEGLYPEESLKLLCQKAFKKNEPEEGFLNLSKEVVEYACGLPLALEVLGSFLCKRKQCEWRETLDEWRKNLDKEIFGGLLISYDGLKVEDYKSIFLDIACFFNGKKKIDVTNILKTCGHHPVTGINVLTEKSLLCSHQSNSISSQNAKDEDMYDRFQEMRRDFFLPTMYHKLLDEASQESLHMHDLLQEMGRNIVLQESPNNAGKRSRLWFKEDIDLVLKGNKGTEEVQSIFLDLNHRFDANWHPDCFSKMQNLSLLDLSKVILSRDLNSLPSKLKYLRWDWYALKSLPPIDQLYELESLQLCNSNIRKLWDRTPSLYKLRIIDLSDSDYLRETPDFSGTPNLEKLFLNNCGNLVWVHESVGQLKKLVELSLQYCLNLVTLPTYLDMNNLEVFILNNCFQLEKLPEFSKNMRRLYFLDVKGTKIIHIPTTIFNLLNLKYLDLSSWRILKSIPKLPPNLFIRARHTPSWESTSDVEYLIASCVSKDPIHFFSDSYGGIGPQRQFKQEEYRHSKDDSSEVVTITADIPCDVEGEGWAIVVHIVFQCLCEAWRGFSIKWEFQDYCHPSNKSHGTDTISTNAYPVDKENCQPHPSGVRSQVDSELQVYFPTTNNIPSGKTVDSIPFPDIESRFYTGFYPIEKKNYRRHPSGVGSQIDLTLCFPKVNTIGSKKRHFRNLEVVDCRWRLVCSKDVDANSSDFEEGRCCINSYQLYGHETLQLSNSKIKELWDGAPSLDMLRIIHLHSCWNLIATPDFSGTPNLEKLLVMYCPKLDRIHESVGQLKKLAKLHLENCGNLVTLPSYLEMDNLEEFILCQCKRLEKLPEFGKNMKKLHFFSLAFTSIIEIPSSIIHLTNLKKLCLIDNDKLKSIPELPPNLIIDTRHCPLLEPTSAVPHLFASNMSKGPIHLFSDSGYWDLNFTELCWSQESSGEVVVTLTADIPCDIADFEGECCAIAIYIYFRDVIIGRKTDFCINWKFQDYCPNSNNNRSHEVSLWFKCGIYVGLYPIVKEHCQPHPSGVGSQIHLTLSLATKETGQNFDIFACGWRLVCKKDVDEWSASSTSDFHAGGSMPSSIYCLHSQRPSILQRAIHLFYDSRVWTRIPTWFEMGEYYWGEDTTSEFVKIRADKPWNVAEFNGECWGIAVCLFLKSLSQAWQGFYIDWKFQNCHTNKTKMDGALNYNPSDCGVYVGFYPFRKPDYGPYLGTKLNLTLRFPTIKITRALKIMGCGWRLARKEDFDEWRENEGPSPSRHGHLNRRGKEESSTSIIKGRQEESTQDLKNDSMEIEECGRYPADKKDFDADTSIPSSISLPALPAEIDKNMEVEECGRSPVDKKDFDAERSIPSSSSFITSPKLPEIDSLEIEECGRSLADKEDLDAERSIPSSTSLPAIPGLQTTRGKTYRRILFLSLFVFGLITHRTCQNHKGKSS